MIRVLAAVSPQYSCVYVILGTDNEDLPAGYGLTFTLGRGNEIVAAMCEALEHLVVGKSLEDDILSDLMGFSRTLTQDGQLRWIGPEKGVLALACGAILNAVWDMWARREQKPLWEMVCDMEPEELIKVLALSLSLARAPCARSRSLVLSLDRPLALL